MSRFGPAGIYGGREEAWRMEGEMERRVIIRGTIEDTIRNETLREVDPDRRRCPVCGANHEQSHPFCDHPYCPSMSVTMHYGHSVLSHPQPPADAPSLGVQEALPLSAANLHFMKESHDRGSDSFCSFQDLGLLVDTALAAHRLQAALEATKRKLREAEELLSYAPDFKCRNYDLWTSACRERDEALAANATLQREKDEAVRLWGMRQQQAQAIITALTEAVEVGNAKLFEANARAERAEADLAELNDETDVIVGKWRKLLFETGPAIVDRAEKAEAEVARLTAALAGARERVAEAIRAADSLPQYDHDFFFDDKAREQFIERVLLFLSSPTSEKAEG